jgi:hypothetical protein
MCSSLTEPNVVLSFLQRFDESLDGLLYILHSHHATQQPRAHYTTQQLMRNATQVMHPPIGS